MPSWWFTQLGGRDGSTSLRGVSCILDVCGTYGTQVFFILDSGRVWPVGSFGLPFGVISEGSDVEGINGSVELGVRLKGVLVSCFSCMGTLSPMLKAHWINSSLYVLKFWITSFFLFDLVRMLMIVPRVEIHILSFRDEVIDRRIISSSHSSLWMKVLLVTRSSLMAKMRPTVGVSLTKWKKRSSGSLTFARLPLIFVRKSLTIVLFLINFSNSFSYPLRDLG